jgi:carbonic anhydrase
MSVTDELLENNAAYAESFKKGELPLPPARGVAVVACMDARLDVHKILGLQEGEAHVIRNAGGVITDDEIRSLTISQRLLGTHEIILIHHTDCGMLTFSDDELKAQIHEDVGLKPHFSMESFSDLEEDVHKCEPFRTAQGERARVRLRGGDGQAARGHLAHSPECVERLSGNSLSGADRALFGSAKRSRWGYFASFHRLVVPRIGAYSEFPDSLGR